MKVHFFTKGDEKIASSRLRAFVPSVELSKKNIECVVHCPSTDLLSTTKWPKKFKLIVRTLHNLASIKKDDSIFLQRTIYNKYFFILIVSYKFIFRRKMIFDFDDAIYLHSFFKTKVLTRISDAVIVGSHTLYDWAKKYNKQVYLIPTSIKYENYVNNHKDFSKQSDKFIIGWLGHGPAHYRNLKFFREVILNLEKNKYKFILVGSLKSEEVYNLFNDIKGIEMEFIDSIEPVLAPKIIQTFDVGVMPLTDDEWSSGKCALKAIEYMACGVPTIASPVGENKYLIEDGINGFLASDSTEWVKKINLLAEDNGLMEEIGTKGRETIENNYTFSVNIPKLAKLIKEA